MNQINRHIGGPHVCGDSIDIDAKNNHLITGSWRKYSTLQVLIEISID